MSDHAHETYVTTLMRQWLTEQPNAVRQLLDTIERENTAAGNWDQDNGGRQVLNEDIEYLADELQELAYRVLPAYCGNGITGSYVRDCISEVDWLDIAMDYLAALVKEEAAS